MLKQSAVLKKKRKAAIAHQSDFGLLKKKLTEKKDSNLERVDSHSKQTSDEAQMAEEDKYNQ